VAIFDPAIFDGQVSKLFDTGEEPVISAPTTNRHRMRRLAEEDEEIMALIPALFTLFRNRKH